MNDLPQKHSVISAATNWALPGKESRWNQIRRIDSEVERANGIAIPALKAVANARRSIGGWDSRFERIFEKALKAGVGGGVLQRWSYELKQLQKEMHKDID
jgi:hypothetical protein